MVIAKVPAVVAAVLFMSSVSAQAMEFADRPGTSSTGSIKIASVGDMSRRQIRQPNILGRDRRTGLVVLNSILVNSNEGERPGRLSAEFIPIVSDGLEYMPVRTSKGRVRYCPTSAAMRFEDRPGFAGARLGAQTTAGNTIADRIVTSSVRKAKVPFGLHNRPSAKEFASEIFHRVVR
jgi:hypothetical protein